MDDEKWVEFLEKIGYEKRDILNPLYVRHFKAFYWYLKRR